MTEADRDVCDNLWNPEVPRRLPDLASILDVVDERIDHLIPLIRALPYQERQEVIQEVCENLEHTRKLCGHHPIDPIAPGTAIPPGLDQAFDLQLMLNYVAVDCEHGGPYPRS